MMPRTLSSAEGVDRHRWHLRRRTGRSGRHLLAMLQERKCDDDQDDDDCNDCPEQNTHFFTLWTRKKKRLPKSKDLRDQLRQTLSNIQAPRDSGRVLMCMDISKAPNCSAAIFLWQQVLKPCLCMDGAPVHLSCITSRQVYETMYDRSQCVLWRV